MAEMDVFDNASNEDVPHGYVRVSKLGSTPQLIPIGDGASVAQCLQRYGEEIPLRSGHSASVGGKIVSDLFGTKVTGGETIVIAGNVANGR